MQRLDSTLNSGSTAYVDGNATTGAGGTVLQAAALNAIQEELATIALDGGGVLDPANNGQVLARIKALIATKQGNYAAGATGITANKTLALADAGKIWSIEAAGLAVTLPAANTVPSGTNFVIQKRSGISASATVTAGGVTILALETYHIKTVTLTSDGASGYTAQEAGANGGFASGSNANGFWKIEPNGMMTQWGFRDFGGATAYNANVTFPIAFPNSALLFLASSGTATADFDSSPSYRTDTSSVTHGAATVTGCTAQLFASNGGNGRRMQWLAIGR